PLTLADAPGLLEAEPGGGTVRPLQPAERPGLAGEPFELELLGTVRHVRLARLTVHPVHYDRERGRWSSLRALALDVGFPGSAAPIDGEADAIDRQLAATVINPSALELALDPPGATADLPPEPTAMTAAKILVREDGLYRVRPADLLAAGIDTSGVDPSTFVLTERGQEVALEVDPNGELLFFGRAVGGEETRDNVYRLTGGVRPGLRMASRAAAPQPADPLPSAFLRSVRSEEDLLYFASVPSAASPWLWEALAVAAPGVPVFSEQTLTLHDLPAGTWTARLEARVQSRRETPGASPNHHVRLLLNGQLVDDRSWSGLLGVTLGADVPQAWLHDGANVVRLELPADLGVPVETEYTDWIRLDYHAGYAARGDYLEFAAEASGPWRFEISGFSGADVRAYDVSDPAAPVRLVGGVSSPAGPAFVHRLSDPLATAPGRFVALRPAAARVPQAITIDAPSDLREQLEDGVDLLVVAHDAFFDAIQPLVELRRDQGLRVVAARLTDFYDEFNGGVAEVQGIRNGVSWAFAHGAPPAPTYLLLVGDATFDPRDNKGEGDNFLPAAFVHASGFGWVPSDTWFAAVSGTDELPDLAVGRISARTASDVDSYVANVLAYENAPPVAALNSRLAYVTDDDDPQFEAVAEHLIATGHPAALGISRIHLSDYPQTGSGLAAARADLKATLDAGALITTYYGHGSRTSWAEENLWQLGDVGGLAPSGRLTFAVALDCVNAFFTNLDAEPYALGEQWILAPDRGAIATWSPSALGTLFNYQVIGDQLFDHVFRRKELRAGYAAWRALLDAYLLNHVDALNVRDLIFFGDPTVRLPLDSDRDGRLDEQELASGSDPDDADSDDDGLSDGAEPTQAAALDPDADDDGLTDGLESGIVIAGAGTAVAAGQFAPDADPASVSFPLSPDSDGGGAPDGAEDRNANGRVDAGETDPRLAADDPVCATQAPELGGLRLRSDGADVVLEWTDARAADPCVLYRVLVAADTVRPTGPSDFAPVATRTMPSHRHLGAGGDARSYSYLVTAAAP
ncbi:MAG TPA: C25 family cysteine peptidase, partial [Candidatus Polarisedimenticolaceae bacterium]|nr:C25 family cysteine peptidase [Candidatus Polarisedimenticolaceae bacterium]